MLDTKYQVVAFTFALTVALTVILRMMDAIRRNASEINRLREEVSKADYVTEAKLDSRLRLHLEPLRVAMQQLVPSHRIPPAPRPPTPTED